MCVWAGCETIETIETEGDHRDWGRTYRLGETIETGGDHRVWGRP